MRARVWQAVERGAAFDLSDLPDQLRLKPIRGRIIRLQRQKEGARYGEVTIDEAAGGRCRGLVRHGYRDRGAGNTTQTGRPQWGHTACVEPPTKGNRATSGDLNFLVCLKGARRSRGTSGGRGEPEGLPGPAGAQGRQAGRRAGACSASGASEGPRATRATGRPPPTMLRLSGDFRGRTRASPPRSTVSSSGPIRTADSGAARSATRGLNGQPLDHLATLVQGHVFVFEQRTCPIASPYLRIFLLEDTHDVVFDRRSARRLRAGGGRVRHVRRDGC